MTINIVKGDGNRSAPKAEADSPELTMHFCEMCHEVYQRENFARAYPPTGEQPIKERLRVIESTSQRTVVRLIRTESNEVPEDWVLLSSRLPEHICTVGNEFGMTFTPSELAYLKGNKDRP